MSSLQWATFWRIFLYVSRVFKLQRLGGLDYTIFALIFLSAPRLRLRLFKSLSDTTKVWIEFAGYTNCSKAVIVTNWLLRLFFTWTSAIGLRYSQTVARDRRQHHNAPVVLDITSSRWSWICLHIPPAMDQVSIFWRSRSQNPNILSSVWSRLDIRSCLQTNRKPDTGTSKAIC